MLDYDGFIYLDRIKYIIKETLEIMLILFHL